MLFAVVRDATGVSVGCGAILLKPEYGEIKRMYVRPQARCQAIARRLLGSLEQQAMKQGCRTFMLETGPAQPGALMFYARPGNQRGGPFGDYPADPLSVIMQKSGLAVNK